MNHPQKMTETYRKFAFENIGRNQWLTLTHQDTGEVINVKWKHLHKAFENTDKDISKYDITNIEGNVKAQKDLGLFNSQ